jgi:hypothetical protein
MMHPTSDPANSPVNPTLNPGVDPTLNSSMDLNPGVDPTLNPSMDLNPSVDLNPGVDPTLNSSMDLNPSVDPTLNPSVDRDEGVIKFACDWEQAAAIAPTDLADHAPLMALMAWRDRLFAWGLIGVYPDGIGFGNVSVRLGGDRFLISGTQTGHLPTTTPDHYTVVDRWDIERNWLHCRGPVRASSESLTHAAIYRQDPAIAAIVHGHHPRLWQTYQHQLPTTRAEVPYGTPAMATEMARLFSESDLPSRRILVMAGHEDGILSFGMTLSDAAQPLAQLLAALAEPGCLLVEPGLEGGGFASHA